jgi:hypothetical protein
MMRQSSSGSFSESLHAVVDHDGNHADGDGDGQHASRYNPGARNPVVDDGANRARGFAGNLRRSSIPTAGGGLKRDRLAEVANAFGPAATLCRAQWRRPYRVLPLRSAVSGQGTQARRRTLDNGRGVTF